MVQHAARAVPWPLLGAAAALLAALLAAVAWEPYRMWPLQGLAVGLLAGSAAFAYDEPAAAVVDTLPRGLAWRTAARSLVVVGLLGWWLVLVTATGSAYFGHAGDVAFQGLAATLAVVATTAQLRRGGWATPAMALATGTVGGAAYLALARPVEDRLPVLPYTDAGPWTESRLLWTLVLLCAAGWLRTTLRR